MLRSKTGEMQPQADVDAYATFATIGRTPGIKLKLTTLVQPPPRVRGDCGDCALAMAPGFCRRESLTGRLDVLRVTGGAPRPSNLGRT
ncbi:hypothetical protein TOPH_00938 [Tolypocladium ophioglossoides CBS 100239]|uniref:Uncharacterized protein n=1 Tax=Tolypocladium ophioglossoides (strain CBS 100239) TaxID=1163406 RepID=A0A0L0NJR4_TOLOC|nr:hypothetical protein TOPH_00938 [Tolypocladium ophioglossoides CBS 100239]